MLRKAYNLLFFLGFLISSPFYFLKMWRRGNWRRGFSQRFARYDRGIKQALTNSDVLWIHAVSVGEVNICTRLIQAIEPRLPNLKILVTTTTSTGMSELERRLPRHILRAFYPIDFPRVVSRALRTLRPCAIILVEAEIWPNFLWRAQSGRIPVFLVNARLSARSYRGYKRFGFLFRSLFESLSGVGVQNSDDAARLTTLGCRPETVRVVGNLKFDAAKLEERPTTDIGTLLGQLGVGPSARVILGGSTHAGEELILAEMFLRLRRQFPDLFLILVPRHFERGKEVGRELQRLGVRFMYRSEIGSDTNLASGDLDCLLVNTTGELRFFYQAASVIFVGKSLAAQGGQNPIEPGALGKAMVFGPNMENFTAITSAFLQNGAALQVKDSRELEQAVKNLLADEDQRAALGRKALAVVRENQGSIERTVQMVIDRLPKDRFVIQDAPLLS